MATIHQQGAGCCGRRILSGMNSATPASIRRDMAEYMRNEAQSASYGRTCDQNGTNKIVEVVTSESNHPRAQIEAALIEVGFVMVAEWDNYLTGSLCRMFLYAPDWTAFPNGAAVPIVPPAALVPEPRPEPRVVFSTYHNVLANGRSEAGWPTRDAASAAAPRARSIDRRDVYASGAVRWTPGV
jgi:hypothetical protein